MPEYPYLYETHLHTFESSRCGQSPAVEMVDACKEAGYTGIFVTDHHWGGNVRIDRNLPWEEWVDQFCDAYYKAKKRGDEIGLQVFFGWEAGFQGTDFLIYGLSPEWMKAHPELRTNLPWGNVPEVEDPLDPEKQYKLIHEAGGMVIHAHPFREEPYIPEIRLFPEYVDGVETVNATHSSPNSRSHNNPEFNVKAWAYAKQYNFPVTAGSDIHSTNLFNGGVAFKRKLENEQDYIKAVLNREDYILTDGVHWFNQQGEQIG
ncbi:MAG: histidinol-phosphatase [Lachnospiraceae bacterium]|nr:histidinol-phosphatase [Lachnospiraceae bacterium]